MNIARNTAKRMLESIEQQLHSLAAEQQSMNGNKGGSQYKCGGRVRRNRMTDGGIPDYLNPNTQPYGQDLTGANSYMLNSDWWNKITNKQQPYALPSTGVSARGYQQLPYPQNQGIQQPQIPLKKVALDTVTGQPSIQNTGVGNIGGMNQHVAGMAMPQFGANTPGLQGTNNPGATGANRPGNSGTAMDWMGLLPTAFNLGAGLLSGKAQHLDPNRFQNPYEQQALAQMPSQYRIDPLLNEYKNAYANTVRNVNNQGNSRGERMANYGAAQNQYASQVGGAYADKFNQENQMAMRKAMMMNEQGAQRAGVNLNVQNINDQNAAAARQNRMGYLGAAASGAQRYSLVNRQMANQQASQQAYINALLKMPHFKEWLFDPNNPLNLQKNGQ